METNKAIETSITPRQMPQSSIINNIQMGEIVLDTTNNVLKCMGTDGVIQTISVDSRPYKVYTALLTQNYVQVTTKSQFEVGKEYRIDAINEDGLIGGFMGNFDIDMRDNFVFTAEMEDWFATQEETLEWLAVVTNLTDSAPQATILENTIGNIWFTYDNIGLYTIKSNSLFTTNKTTFFMGIMDINPGQPIIGSDHFASDESTYQILITDSATYAQHGFLSNTPIEIRVYN